MNTALPVGLMHRAVTLLTRSPLPIQTAGGGIPPAPSEAPCAPRRLLIQTPANALERAVQALALGFASTTEVHCIPLDNVPAYGEVLRSGSCLPVGNRAFLRAALAACDLALTSWNPYPEHLLAYMPQLPRVRRAANVLAGHKPAFVRPVIPGTFEAFVLRANRCDMDEHGNVQLDALLTLPPSELVWASGVLDIVSAWRYYVTGGEVIGYARVDSADGAAAPKTALEEVSSIVAVMSSNASYALDMAVLRDGQTSLLALRHPLAVDLIFSSLGAPSAADYTRFLWTAWSKATAGLKRTTRAQ